MNDESTSLMDPMMPSPLAPTLQDLALELTQNAALLSGKSHPVVQRSVGDLVRSMNCYYSNLIEGHETHPRDIDRALNNDFSAEPEKRNLQLEAKAHIRIQKMIDDGMGPNFSISADYLRWLHREFCDHLPKDLLWVENPDTGEKVEVIAGELRTGYVSVGRHLAPKPESLPRFLNRFEEAYTLNRLGRMDRVIAMAALHHRFLWIHPFVDGNGRVARLLSHAYLKHIGIGSSLWSVSRGLARNKDAYKNALAAADLPRQGDLDGRGSLTQKGLEDLCEFFLRICIDQISFMDSLLQTDALLRRIELYTNEEIHAKRLPKGSYQLLREALLVGEVDRGRAGHITGYKERQARSVLKTLTDRKLLISDTPKGAIRLGFPLEVVERWFPSLYPFSLQN